MRKIILDDWQEEVLKSAEAGDNLLLCTGRQIGKTQIMAIAAAREMMKKECHIIVVSLTEDQAKLIIFMILDYLETNARNLICDGIHKPTQNKIELRNRSHVIARPVGNTGDAVRGFTGDILIIDEASRFPQLAWDSAKPTLLTTGGRIWMCSTPFGKKGHFYESYLNKEGRYKVFHKSSEEVIKNRKISETWTAEIREKSIKFLDDERKSMSELRYGQEYLGLFLEDLRSYFPPELIERCCTAKRPERIKVCDQHYMGCDLARMGGDETSFEIVRRIREDLIIQVENIVKVRRLTTETEDDIVAFSKAYDMQKVYIDAGAGTLGVSILDHLLRIDETKDIVIPINNRTRPLDKNGEQTQRILKEDLYDNLKSLMEKGHIQLLDDPEVKLSLASTQWEFVKEDDGMSRIKISSNYGHIAEGLVRAAFCSKEKDLNIWIRSIRA
jgi:hypothetical protein